MATISLSQAHLTLLDTCDRKYQYIFFDALAAPTTYDRQITAQWGSQFHLLMQQRAMNLPIEAIAPANKEMTASMEALAAAAPQLFEQVSHTRAEIDADTDKSFTQSEHRRTLAFNGYLLAAIYDLVVISPNQGQIFDWKTHQKPPKKDWLQQDWQTRLYLYILCETTELKPEQISMTYWFVRLGKANQQPSFYQFGYSWPQHQQTRQDLSALTSKLARMIEQLEFPKVPVGSELCDTCAFNVRCDRATPSSASLYESMQVLREASGILPESVEEIPL